jgi:hypothetical protein
VNHRKRVARHNALVTGQENYRCNARGHAAHLGDDFFAVFRPSAKHVVDGRARKYVAARGVDLNVQFLRGDGVQAGAKVFGLQSPETDLVVNGEHSGGCCRSGSK